MCGRRVHAVGRQMKRARAQGQHCPGPASFLSVFSCGRAAHARGTLRTSGRATLSCARVVPFLVRARVRACAGAPACAPAHACARARMVCLDWFCPCGRSDGDRHSSCVLVDVVSNADTEPPLHGVRGQQVKRFSVRPAQSTCVCVCVCVCGVCSRYSPRAPWGRPRHACMR